MRKLLLLGAALALSSTGYAQRTATLAAVAPPSDPNPPITAWADAIGPVFQHVDRSQVTSGILEEYGYSFIDWAPYTGAALTPDNSADASRWRRLYGALYRSRFGPNAPFMPKLAQINAQWQSYAADSLVELPVLHFRYHRFRPDAVQQNLVQVQNNQIYDVAGRAQSPYEPATAFVVAPTQNRFATNKLRFVFRQNMFYSNLGQLPNSLQVDFGDGQGYRGAAWDAPLAVTYADTGRYDLRFRLGYADGSLLQSHALIRVAQVPPATRYDGSADVEEHVVATRTWAGASGPAGANISIEYNGSGPPVLDKPLIIIEGYDPSGIVQTIDPYNYESFIGGIDNGVVLNDGLDAAGYDLVFVDFDNGVDYLQNNAYLIQEVIARVNQLKRQAGSNEPNVIIGQSMGGLIARYALRDLELTPNAPAHEVRLLITHDSPHRGANAPLSAQAAVRHLAGIRITSPLPIPGGNNNSFGLTDEFPELGQAYDLLAAPASQQLLAYGTTGKGANANAAVVGTTAHDQWQTEYDNQGLPQGSPQIPCRVVATSNGAECAKSQPFGPGARLATITGGAEVFRFEWYYPVLGALNGRLSPPMLWLNPGRLALLLPLIGAYDASVSFRLNALPDQQSQEVYYGYAGLQKRKPILGLIPISVQLFSKTVNSRSQMLPLDSAPGSFIGADPADIGLDEDQLPPGLSLVLGVNQFCFVPTPSALDVPLASSQVLNNTYSPSQRASYGSPFANVVTAGRDNLFHIDYDQHNSQWMLNEMANNAPILDCQAFCQAPLAINGPAMICPTGSTYFIAGLPAGTTVRWNTVSAVDVSPVGFVFSPVYNVSATGASGPGLIEAHVISPCGEVSLSLPVYIGEGHIALPPVAPVCNFSPVRIQAQTLGVSSAAVYTWTVDGEEADSDGPELLIPHVPRNGSGVLQVEVTLYDACGKLLSATTGVPYEDCNAAVGRYAVYPNPAADDLTVEESQQASFQATLYDAQGQPRRQQNARQGRLRLDTRALPAGLYYLQLRRGNHVERRQIQVTH